MTDSEVGDLHLGTVVVNTYDVPRAVAFWSAALGYRPRSGSLDDETFVKLVDPAGARASVSVQLTDAKPQHPVRVHLDLFTREQQRHVERLVTLGARRVDDWPYPPDADFVVLRDPDDNEFCVIQLPDRPDA